MNSFNLEYTTKKCSFTEVWDVSKFNCINFSTVMSIEWGMLESRNSYAIVPVRLEREGNQGDLK